MRLPLGSRMGYAPIFAIAIAIPIHIIEKNRNRNRVIKLMCDWTIASELVVTYHKVFGIPGEAPVVAETVHVTTLPCGHPVFPAGPGPVQFHTIHPRLLVACGRVVTNIITQSLMTL